MSKFISELNRNLSNSKIRISDIKKSPISPLQLGKMEMGLWGLERIRTAGGCFADHLAKPTRATRPF